MTRKTFKTLLAAALVTAAAQSAPAAAYFAVSLPGNALTMGGPAYADPAATPRPQAVTAARHPGLAPAPAADRPAHRPSRQTRLDRPAPQASLR